MVVDFLIVVVVVEVDFDPIDLESIRFVQLANIRKYNNISRRNSYQKTYRRRQRVL
jgi:hypothetical protein